MRVFWVWLLCGVLGLGSLGATRATAAAAPGEPIVFGAILSTTGGFAPLGEPERNALMLAEKQINAKGGIAGRPLKIEIVDDEGKPDVASQLATQFIGKKVVAIIGGSITPTSGAIARVTQAANIPQFFMTPTAQLWDTKNGVVKNLFESVPRNEVEAAALLDFAREKLKTKKIAVLYDENQYGVIGSQILADEAKKRNLEVVAKEVYPTNATDVTGQLLRVRDAGADTIAIWGASPACPLIVRQVRQLGLKIHIFGTTGILSDNFLKVAGKDGEGVYSDSNVNFTYPSSIQRAFLNLYRDAYRGRPANFAAFAWDAVFMLAGAIGDTKGKTDGAALIDALERMQPYNGAVGTFRMTVTDHNGLTVKAVHPAVDRNQVWFTLPA